MLTAFYSHRLPADYDTSILRARARQRGALWDTAPELYYKAFLLREAGRFGATGHHYASLYLWRHDAAFRDFIVDGRYRNVTSSFGRARIHVETALDARRGAATQARFAIRDTVLIRPDADLDAAVAGEIERNRDEARAPGVAAAVVSLNTRDWTITRTLLSDREPVTDAGTVWQILHLAQPLLATLGERVEA